MPLIRLGCPIFRQCFLGHCQSSFRIFTEVLAEVNHFPIETGFFEIKISPRSPGYHIEALAIQI
jgi:hypothetical protein